MSEKLKPCPFCGNEAELGSHTEGDDDNGYYPVWSVSCQGCKVRTPDSDFAASAWNHRLEKNEWISVDDFKPTTHCYVHAYCNDIVNGWVELLKVYVCPEYGNYTFENLDGDDYECIPAIITHVKLVDKPTPPKEL